MSDAPCNLSKKVTAIIKTFERPEKLLVLIQSIRTFYPDLPIVIVDDSRQPLSAPWDKKTRYIHTAYDIGLSAGRNIAVQAVQTPYTLLLDDDFVFTKNSEIGLFLSVLEKTSFSLVAGNVYDEGRWLRSYKGLFAPYGNCLRLQYCTRTPPNNKFPVYEFVNNFFLAHTNILKEIPWDPELKIREHEDFFWRLKLANIAVTFTDRVSIDHYPNEARGIDDPAYHHNRILRADFFHDLACKKMGFDDYFFNGVPSEDVSLFARFYAWIVFAVRERKGAHFWAFFLWNLYVCLHSLLHKPPEKKSLAKPPDLSFRRPWRILIFPAESDTGLAIYRALRDSKEVVLIGASLQTPSAAEFYFRKLQFLPPLSSKDCLPALRRLIEEEQIDAIFPAQNDSLAWLIKNVTDIKPVLLTAKKETCLACLETASLYEKLPSFSSFLSFFADRQRFVFNVINSEEYTVDCFSHRKSGVLFAQARQCLQNPAGAEFYTTLAPHFPALKWARKIHASLPMQGSWHFTVRKNAEGRLQIHKVVPMLAAGFSYAHATGPNLPLLSLFEAAGFALSTDFYQPNLVMGHDLNICFFYSDPIEALYVELEGVLLLENNVNARLVSLLFHFRNRHIPVCLLTKYRGDLAAMLFRYKLSNLFDRIVHLPTGSAVHKAEAIKEQHAVYIDSSFSERAAVHREKPNVRCFDTAAAMCLWDDRYKF